jgi:hypothetical protein
MKRRGWASLAVAVAVLLQAAAAWSSVEVADPRTFPHATQHARITVFFDGKPLAGSKIGVEAFASTDFIVTLTADGSGQAVLPELPEGFWQILAWSDLYPGLGAGFDICIGPCFDAFEIVDLTVNSLDGDVTAVKKAAPADEFTMEVGPFQFPPPTVLLAAAETKPTAEHLREFRGVVRDPTGAAVPGAWIKVVRKGTQGKDEVALLRSGAEGKFSAGLPDGEYVVLITALGFQARAIPLTIAQTGDANGLQVVLMIGITT